MPGFFDRLGRAAQQTASAAQQAAAEAKVQLEIRQIDSKFDEKAAELGKLVYRQQQGEDVPDADLAARINELREIDAEHARKEAELQAMKAPVAATAQAEPRTTVVSAPPPPAAETEPVSAPADVATGEELDSVEAIGGTDSTAEGVRRCECGTEIPPAARFCPNCGRSRPA